MDGGGEGTETPPTTQATKVHRAIGRDKERTGQQRTATLPRPQQGTAAVRDSAGTLLRHTVGTEVARLEHGALARRKYGLLALTGQAVDTAAARTQVSRDGHEANRGMAYRARRETEAGEGTQQRAFSTHTPRVWHARGQR